MFKTPTVFGPRIPAYFDLSLAKRSAFAIHSGFVQESWISFINMSRPFCTDGSFQIHLLFPISVNFYACSQSAFHFSFYWPKVTGYSAFHSNLHRALCNFSGIKVLYHAPLKFYFKSFE